MAFVWLQVNEKNNKAFSFFFVLQLSVFEMSLLTFCETHYKFCFCYSSRFTADRISLCSLHRWYFLSILAKDDNQRNPGVTHRPGSSYAGNINACPISAFVMIKWFTTVIIILGKVVHNITNEIIIIARYWLDPHRSNYCIASSAL